jgi:hypothetical protein
MFRSISARDPNENNQKLGLLAALLRAGAWPLADTLLNRLPRTYCVAQVPLRTQRGYLLAVLRIRIQRIHMFLCHPDPDPLVRGMDPAPDPSIVMQK